MPSLRFKRTIDVHVATNAVPPHLFATLAGADDGTLDLMCAKLITLVVGAEPAGAEDIGTA
jgi:hypothetical protein